MAKKYAIKTENGSFYEIEDHSGLLGKKEWTINMKGRTYYLADFSERKIARPEDLSYEPLKKRFKRGRMAIFTDEKDKRGNFGFTSKIEEIYEKIA